jgi:hypothetical protein
VDQIGNVSGECPLAELVVISLRIFSPNIPAHKSENLSVHDISLGDIPENIPDTEIETSATNSTESSRQNRNHD